MKNKILENWKAIEEVEKQMQEKTGDHEAGFNAGTFWVDSQGRRLMLSCKYRQKKKDGFTKGYKEMMVYATFCPFTGKPLYSDEE